MSLVMWQLKYLYNDVVSWFDAGMHGSSITIHLWVDNYSRVELISTRPVLGTTLTLLKKEDNKYQSFVLF